MPTLKERVLLTLQGTGKPLPEWRNWQTRTVQGRVGFG